VGPVGKHLSLDEGCGRWNPVKIACAKRRSAIGLSNSPTPKALTPCWQWLHSNGESWRKEQPNGKRPIGHLCRKRYVRTSAGAVPLKSSNVGRRRSAHVDNVGQSLLAFWSLAIAAPGRDLSIAAAHVDNSIEIRAMPYQSHPWRISRSHVGVLDAACCRPASLLYSSRFEKPYGKYAMSDVRLKGINFLPAVLAARRRAKSGPRSAT
jgi:hypothetical protein